MDPVVVSAALGHAARLLNIGAACLAVYVRIHQTLIDLVFVVVDACCF